MAVPACQKAAGENVWQRVRFLFLCLAKIQSLQDRIGSSYGDPSSKPELSGKSGGDVHGSFQQAAKR